MVDTDIKNILVVDDSKILVHSMERHLRREGFEVVMAYDGRMAKDLVLAADLMGATFDLVIADIHMPNMAGFVFVSWLNLNFPQVVVLVVSGFGNLDMVNKILRPHVDFLHRKPVLPHEIMCSIHKINQNRHQGTGIAEGA